MNLFSYSPFRRVAKKKSLAQNDYQLIHDVQHSVSLVFTYIRMRNPPSQTTGGMSVSYPAIFQMRNSPSLTTRRVL